MNQQNHTIEPEELMAYLDGELSPERAADTAAHLNQCKECQSLAAEFGEVSRGLLAWEVEAGNAAIPPVIAEALDEREKKTTQSEAGVSGLIQSIWAWLKNPKTLRRRAWQLAGVGIVAVMIAMVAIPNRLRNPAAAKFVLDQQRPESRPSAYLDQYDSALTKRSPDKSTTTGSNFQNGLGNDVTRSSRVPGPPPPKPWASSLEADGQPTEDEPVAGDIVANGPMIVRSAQLTVTMKDFDLARKSVDDILKRYKGYIGDLTVNTPNGAARSINAKLRIPSAQLDSALTALKALGRVEAEAQNGEEVTQQYVDLNARLSNARKTQQRLIEIQRDRTGKLSDVLSVELQISRVQGEIEQMEAQLKTMKNQVSFASLDLTISEQYKAELKVVPPSLGDQLRNAGIDGIRSIRDTVVSVLFWLLSTGPILLFWIFILFYPARLAWKKVRARLMPSA